MEQLKNMVPSEYRKLTRLAADCSRFGFNFLIANVKESDFRDPARGSLLLLFVRAQSDFDGVIALLHSQSKLQPNTAQLQIRSMFEIWIEVTLIAGSGEWDTWSRYLQASSRARFIKRAKALYEAGVMKRTEYYLMRESAKKQIASLTAKPFNFPDMPIFKTPVQDVELEKFRREVGGLIVQHSGGKKSIANQLNNLIDSKQKRARNFINAPLGILEMCRIVDYYQPPKSGAVGATRWYQNIYTHLSDYAHADLSNASGAVRESSSQISTDIAGDAAYSPGLLSSAIAFYLGCLKYLAVALDVDIEKPLIRFGARLEK